MFVGDGDERVALKLDAIEGVSGCDLQLFDPWKKCSLVLYVLGRSQSMKNRSNDAMSINKLSNFIICKK